MTFLKQFIFKSIFILCILFAGHMGHAATSDNLFGNAWSYNIGWISFNNCANPYDSATCGAIDYGVKYSPGTDRISGYAWNDNVGWISFNPADWGECPPAGSGSATCDTGSNPYTSYINQLSSAGWGRVLSVKSGNNRGGWDGWIHLGNSSGNYNYSAWFGNGNEASNMGSGFPSSIVDVRRVNGFWWGSDVVGWIYLGGDPYNSLNASYGGVFKIKVSLTGNMTLTASQNPIISGDTVDLSWTADFTPTSCTGSGSGTYSDWATTTYPSNVQAGKFTGIHVPNNATTQFILSCTGTDSNNATVSGSASVSVTASPLTAGISYAGQCMNSGDTKPSVNWTTNDTSASCTITATPADNSVAHSFATGTTPGTIQDTSFGYKNTYYSISCTNGAGSYQATATSTTSAYIGMCIPNYIVGSANSCQGGYGAVVSKVAGSNPSTYSAKVPLALTALNGFTSNVSLSGSVSGGTFSLSPSSGFTRTNGTYNGVDATLSLTQTQYNTMVTNMSNKILKTVSLTATGSAQNTNSKTVNINYCYVGGGSTGGTLTLSGPSSVTSGDTADITYNLTGFSLPTTVCTGSGGFSDWNKNFYPTLASDTISGIHVPNNVTTSFTLSCSDGSSSDTKNISITANPLTASLSYAGSCMQSGGTKPTLSWSTNDGTSNCTITGTDGSGSHTLTVTGGTSGTKQDTSYGYSDTYYSMTCTNGAGAYKATAVAPISPYIKMCVPDYIPSSNACTVVTQIPMLNPVTYTATVPVNISAVDGFTSNVSVSGSSNVGTFSLNPSTFTGGGIYNTVDATLTLSQNEYNTLVSNKVNNVLKTITLQLTGASQNTTTKNFPINYYENACSGGSLSLSPNTNSIISGGTVDISWSVSGFTPTSCTGSGTGTYADWAKTTGVNSTSGTFSGIHVPNDTMTTFRLTCTDGGNTATATTNITATALTAGLSYGGSCLANSAATKPSLSWTTNSSNASCTITGTDSVAAHDIGPFTSGATSGTKQDTSYGYKDTTYVMTCTNGSGMYKATASSQSVTRVTMCVPDYTISGSSYCRGNIGGVMTQSTPGGDYSLSLPLTLTALGGFNSNATVSGSSSIGTLSFNSNVTTFTNTAGSYNTITPKLTISETEYNSLLKKINNNVLTQVILSASGSAQNTNTKNITLNFCATPENDPYKLPKLKFIPF